MNRIDEPPDAIAEEHKGISRRNFLKAGAAVGTVAVVAACTPKVATTTPTSAPGSTTPPSPSPTGSPAAETYLFFNMNEAAMVKAICGQVIPGTPQDPGAVEAGAHIYIDHALSGAYSSQQVAYRRGLTAMNAYSQAQYKSPFASLNSTQQAAVLTDMQGAKATGFDGPSSVFFGTLLSHVKEGTFCDPVYGGNQNFVGWKMVGFPGAQVAYGEGDMAIGADQSKKTPAGMATQESITMPAPSGPSAGF